MATVSAARACRSTCFPAATSASSPPTTNSSVAPTDRSTSAAGSRPIPATPPNSPATAPPSVPNCQPRRRRTGQRRLRRRPRHDGRVATPRPRDQPAQGRHDPPVRRAAQPRARALRPRRRPLGHRPRRQRPGLPLNGQRRRPGLDRTSTVVGNRRRASRRAAFDPERGTGVVLHMLACLAVDGRFGATAIGTNPAHADELFEAMLTAIST